MEINEHNELFEDLEDITPFGDAETEDFDGEDDEDFDDETDFAIELTNVKNRTAVLHKNNMIALLGVQTFDQGGTICRVDPRQEKPSVQIYDNAEEAMDWFTRSLSSSRRNGWKIVYDGLPLHG